MTRKRLPDEFSLVATCTIFLLILIQFSQCKNLYKENSQRLNSRLLNFNETDIVKRSQRSINNCDCKNHKFKDPTARLDRNARVINGNKAEEGDFPWQVMIQKFDGEQNTWGFHCGGVLISEKFVITAEHCMGLDTKSYRLIVGNLDRSTANKDTKNHYEIDQYISYRERPSVQYEHDIALLRIKKVNGDGSGVECNANIQPICLEGAPNFEEGKQCFLSGWGATEKGETSKQLLYASIPLQSKKTCQTLFNDRRDISFDRFTKNMICSGIVDGMKKNKRSASKIQNGRRDVPDACQGDSGGPLACIDDTSSTAYLTGVVSFGVGKCGQGPSVYVKVPNYVQWIQEEMAAWI